MIHQSDFTDAVLAERVAQALLRNRFCYTGGLGWLEYTGKQWQVCEEVAVIECVRAWVVAQSENAIQRMRTGGADESEVKKWLQMLSRAKITAVVSLAKGIPGVAAVAEDFDADPDLLNVDNGVVDLRTGVLMLHSQAFKLTKMAPVTYNPLATHPDWDKALEAVPEDVRAWYQLRMGQAITGYMTPDDVLLVQVGGGENGKTSVTGAIMETLGDYAVMVSDKVILASPNAHSTEKMELKGARFALIEETPEARRLAPDRLKKTVGTTVMEARYVYQNQVKWKASHTLILSTNYIPVVEEVDHGTWRRLLLMRFPFTFRKEYEPCEHTMDRPGDAGLRARLTDSIGPQHEAILTWLVVGAVCWYKAGKQMPAPPIRVLADTREWRRESDLVLGYIDEHLEFADNSHVAAKDLLAGFNEWLTEHGHKGWSDKLLASRFGDHYEVTQRHVIKKKVRRSEALSRRWLANPLGHAQDRATPPQTYWAWEGVKFAEKSSTSGNYLPVPGVPGLSNFSL